MRAISSRNAPPADSHPVVYIVDDDDGMRGSMEALFRSVARAVEAFASAREFLSAYATGRPGCLIADVRMPDMSGIELYAEMQRRSIDLPVIFVTGYGDVDTAVGAMKAGAIDFIVKPFKAQELLDRAQRAIDRSVELSRRRDEDAVAGERLARLTARERQVLDLIVAGESSKHIAHRLDLSLRTIEFHRANIMSKLEARSVADLVKMAIGRGT